MTLWTPQFFIPFGFRKVRRWWLFNIVVLSDKCRQIFQALAGIYRQEACPKHGSSQNDIFLYCVYKSRKTHHYSHTMSEKNITYWTNLVSVVDYTWAIRIKNIHIILFACDSFNLPLSWKCAKAKKEKAVSNMRFVCGWCNLWNVLLTLPWNWSQEMQFEWQWQNKRSTDSPFDREKLNGNLDSCSHLGRNMEKLSSFSLNDQDHASKYSSFFGYESAFWSWVRQWKKSWRTLRSWF